MSRIGKTPIILHPKVNIKIKDNYILISGPKGELKYSVPKNIKIIEQQKKLIIQRKDESKNAKALHGLSRTIINNMVIGVSQGFCKILKIQGVGYRAQIDNQNNLILNVGYSHPINIITPPEINIEVENNTLIKIKGIDKAYIGELAAKIRSIRPPEIYKGKGIRYDDEIIKKKIGKAGK